MSESDRTTDKAAAHIRGERHYRAKLTDHDVRLMRGLRALGLPYTKIAEKFEVCYSAAYKAVNYWSWSHVR